MERRSLTRREFIAGAVMGLAAASIGRVEAKSKKPDQTTTPEINLETAHRRQAIHAHMTERWFTPQTDCDGKSHADMLSELHKTMGEWIRIFKHLNKIEQALACTTNLQNLPPNDPAWAQASGPAAELEALYHSYWDADTFATERRQPEPIHIENADYVGFRDETHYREFFTDGQFVPKGWLQPVKKMVFTDYLLNSIIAGRISGQSVPTLDGFLHKESKRELKLSGRTAFNGRFLLQDKIDDIYHEIAHANDWDTGHYPADLKIKTYWKVVQRMQLPQQGGTSVRTRAYHHENASRYDRWRNAMEYWAEISKDYCQNKKLAPEDQAIVEAVVRSSDPDYDPKKIAPQVDTAVMHISLSQLEQLIVSETIIIKTPEQRQAFQDLWQQYKALHQTSTTYEATKKMEKYVEQMMQQFPPDAAGQFDRQRRIEGYLINYRALTTPIQPPE